MEAKVNEKSYIITHDNDSVEVNGNKQVIDIQSIDQHTISLVRNGLQTTAQIVEVDRTEKKVILLIEQETYEIELKDKMDLLLKDLGMSEMLVKKMPNLSSPMPGLIVSVAVEAGQTIAKGDTLIILEAMKMENSLKASAEGIVAEVMCKAGDSVEKGQTLITFE